MSKNFDAAKRGFVYDPVTLTMDMCVNGKIVVKYAGDDLSVVYTNDTAQKYDVGTLLQSWNKKFRYCYAHTAHTRYVGAANTDQWSVTNAATNASAVVGAKSFSVANTDATKNSLVGGSVTMFTSPLQHYTIIANDASDGTNTTLYIDGALTAALTAASTWCTAYKNLYGYTQAPGSISSYVDYITFVSVPVCTVAATSWFWGQTAGPCYGVAGSTVPGSAAQQREVYFSTAGNVLDYGDGNAGAGMQYAGYLLPRTANGSGDQLYMLQLES